MNAHITVFFAESIQGVVEQFKISNEPNLSYSVLERWLKPSKSTVLKTRSGFVLRSMPVSYSAFNEEEKTELVYMVLTACEKSG